MVEVNPKLTPAQLRKGARKTSEGEGIAPLPGVKTDAKQAAEADPADPLSPYYGSTSHDPDGYQRNRELSERISQAVEQLKESDEHGPRFLLAWRLYPNKDHPAWQQKDVHFCGCGCGCSAPGPSYQDNPDGRTSKKKGRTSRKRQKAKRAGGRAKT